MAAAEETVRELVTVESGTLAILNKSEIDQQITTARRYPRSTQSFMRECMGLATISEAVADECFYALPRDGKMIEGPSARFAEIVAHAWGNARAGARVIDDQGEFVTAQGVFHDLEKNVAITYEVKRRIVDKHGRRFKPDMIGVTANAACSIALRNAVFKGVPKAIWNAIYLEVRKVAAGDAKTLATRRAEVLASLCKLGATREAIFGVLEVKGEEDITLDHIVTLKGIGNAIKDGDTTVEQAFPPPEGSVTSQVKRKTDAAPTHTHTPTTPEPPAASQETADANASRFEDLILAVKEADSLETLVAIDNAVSRDDLTESQAQLFVAAVEKRTKALAK